MPRLIKGGLFGQWQSFVNQVYPDPGAASTAAPATKHVEGRNQLGPRSNTKKRTNHYMQRRTARNIKENTNHGVQRRSAPVQQIKKKRNPINQAQEQQVIIVYAKVPDENIGGRVESEGGRTQVPDFFKFLDYLNEDIPPTVEFK